MSAPVMLSALLPALLLLAAGPSAAAPPERPECVPITKDGACIEAVEYTNGRFAAFLTAHGGECKGRPCYEAPAGRAAIFEKGEAWEVVRRKHEHPVVFVTWHAAKAACEHDGGFLCSSEQWSKACSPDGRRFAYGKTFDGERCNLLERSVGAPLPVGNLKTCTGGLEGIHDMSGNVWEWVDTCIKGRCLVRGGSFSTYVDFAPCAYKDGHYPIVREPNVGFRCCRAPKVEQVPGEGGEGK
jgi:formylglycine-generating enzyme